jgi:protein SCO1/2
VTKRWLRGKGAGGAAAAAALLLMVLAACGEEAPYVPAGIVRSPAPDVSSVSLPDVSAGGIDFVFRAAEGELLILYFGYTACPDICPTTMADLRSALRELGGRAARVAVGMVTIDPHRDTDDIITAYVHAFFPEGHAFRTDDPDALRAAADAFGAGYAVTIDDEGVEEVVHTAFLYAIDDTGHLRLMWPFGIESEDIARDLNALLEEQQG